jgi:hypothetical protein
VALLAVIAVAVAVAAIPMVIMAPFKPQSAAAMALAYTLRRLAPAVTLLALAAGVALAWRLWSSTRWVGRGSACRLSRHSLLVGRVLLVAALLPIGAACWLARQNLFEWLFPPLARTGYAPAAAAAAFVDPGDLVLAIQVQGDAAAYPVRQVAFHHVVEDVVGGTPVAVTY